MMWRDYVSKRQDGEPVNQSRRGFLGLLGAVAAGAVIDPERALWIPGRRLISIPRERVLYTQHYEFRDNLKLKFGDIIGVVIPGSNEIVQAAIVSHDQRILAIEADCETTMAFMHEYRVPSWTTACRVGRQRKRERTEAFQHLTRFDPDFAIFPEGRALTARPPNGYWTGR
jgi:hypothetical protein